MCGIGCVPLTVFETSVGFAGVSGTGCAVSGVVASRVDGGFVVSVPFEVAEEFVDALVVLGERLIGEVPPVLREVEAALWAGAESPVRLLPAAPTVEDAEDSEPVGSGRSEVPGIVVGEQGWGAFVQEASVTHRAESFLAFMAGQDARRREALRVWLDRYAEEFGEARVRWERDWVWSLEAEFVQREGAA